jgi:hypothetical protein
MWSGFSAIHASDSHAKLAENLRKSFLVANAETNARDALHYESFALSFLMRSSVISPELWTASIKNNKFFDSL